MAANRKPNRHLVGNRVASAKSKTEKVQEDIALAEAELHLENTVIIDKLGRRVSDAELARAVAHNETVEDKLRDASEDLQVVTDLLKSEEHDREQLEKALAEYRSPDGPTSAGARSGAGSASVIEHLRELTRHKLNMDHADPGQYEVAAKKPPKKPGPGSR